MGAVVVTRGLSLAGFNEWEEDLHRQALLETPGLDAMSAMCHAMQLDSKGFVRHCPAACRVSVYVHTAPGCHT
eukprot:m.818652 g.818652  ORF g.818652 m.818652 type:complete len:73 (-) comp23394_c0_seq189:3127-3345(-)